MEQKIGKEEDHIVKKIKVANVITLNLIGGLTWNKGGFTRINLKLKFPGEFPRNLLIFPVSLLNNRLD